MENINEILRSAEQNTNTIKATDDIAKAKQLYEETRKQLEEVETVLQAALDELETH